MKIEIDTLQIKDLPRLLNLVTRCKHDQDDSYYAQALSRDSIQSFVLKADGVDVAWCFLNNTPKYNLYARLNAPEIQDLNVHPAYWRRGFATQLIQHCETVATKAQKKYMGISFGLTSHYGAAQVLYTKLGYLPDGAGLMYDRKTVATNQTVTADDDLCLMLLKELSRV